MRRRHLNRKQHRLAYTVGAETEVRRTGKCTLTILTAESPSRDLRGLRKSKQRDGRGAEAEVVVAAGAVVEGEGVGTVCKSTERFSLIRVSMSLSKLAPLIAF